MQAENGCKIRDWIFPNPGWRNGVLSWSRWPNFVLDAVSPVFRVRFGKLRIGSREEGGRNVVGSFDSGAVKKMAERQAAIGSEVWIRVPNFHLNTKRILWIVLPEPLPSGIRSPSSTGRAAWTFFCSGCRNMSVLVEEKPSEGRTTPGRWFWIFCMQAETG